MLTTIVSIRRCLEAIAEKHVKCAREEEENYYSGENRIAHKWTLWLRLRCVIKLSKSDISEFVKPHALW